MSLAPWFCQVTLWTCMALLLFAYVGYPLVIWCCSQLFGRVKVVPAAPERYLPSLSLLIVAHNEEAAIEERLENALMTDYPAEQMEIVVASDGSSDATPSIVRGYQHRGVRLLEYTQRRGKAAVINRAIRELSGEVVLLSDANTSIDATAARNISRWFHDPAVGVVCGQLLLTSTAAGSNVDNLYWRYENSLKKSEGRLGALLGANGAIYALRRRLFVPVPDSTIVDDFVIPLAAKLRSGCEILYDPESLAREEIARDLSDEFRRRARLGAGGYQSLRLLWRLLDPRRGWIAFSYFAHKVLRWFGPFFLTAALACNACLLHRPFYLYLFFAQLAFYFLSIVAIMNPVPAKPLRFLLLAPMFTGMNAALLVGFWRWLMGIQCGVWKRTARPAELSGNPR